MLFFMGKAAKYTVWTAMVIFFYHYYLVSKKEKPEESFGALAPFIDAANRVKWHIDDIKLIMTRPPIEKLLPDPPPLMPGQIFPKTLILNLRGTLVCSEYKFGEGFEFKKRPGLSAFLNRMSQMYEVVVFGDEEQTTVHELCEALDPQYRIISGRFGHEHTLLKDGAYVKDLSYMNRDVKKIVVVEADDEKVKFHKDNVIVLPMFTGDKSD